MKKIGFTWLQEELNIQGFRLTHESYIGKTDKNELSSTNTVVRTFKSKYDVKTNNLMSHLEFAFKYDELKNIIQDIVDMPDKKIDHMIMFLHQNKGELASRKRKFYKELSDSEIGKMEKAYKRIFEKK